jgi:hypothetical protein
VKGVYFIKDNRDKQKVKKNTGASAAVLEEMQIV